MTMQALHSFTGPLWDEIYDWEVVETLQELDILNMSWENDFESGTYPPFKLRVLHWDKDEECKKIHLLPPPFLPYMHVKKDIIEKAGSAGVGYLRQTDPGYQVFDEGSVFYTEEPMLRLGNSTPAYTKKVRNVIGIEHTGEADVPYWRRVMADLSLLVKDVERILYLDIECDPRPGMSRREEAIGRLLSIGCTDWKGNEWFFCDDDEKKMIEGFLILQSEFKLLGGWNLERFDIPYLTKRAHKVGLKGLTDFYLPSCDGIHMYRQMNPKGVESYSLDAIGHRELGRGKTEDFDTPGKIKELWRFFKEDRDTLREYNINDCHLVEEIDQKLGMTDLRVELARLTYMLPTRIRGRMSASDNLILNTALQQPIRTVYPTKSYTTDADEGYEGPLVFEPIPGVHDWVIVVDFKNMHPSIIIALNLGIDTWCEDKSGHIKAPNGSFRIDKPSTVSLALDGLTKVRYDNKDKRDTFPPQSDDWFTYDKRQKAAKTQLLTTYGILGSPKSRYYNPDVAENITVTCKIFQVFCKKICEKYGFEVVYGVTDSLFLKPLVTVQSMDHLLAISERLVDALNVAIVEFARLTFNLPHPELLKVDLDRIYRKFYITHKKAKYAGYVCWEEDKLVDYLHVMGFQSRRGSATGLTRKTVKRLVAMRLDGKSDPEISAYLNGVKHVVFSGRMDDQLVTRIQLVSEPEAYQPGTPPPHVRVAIKMRDLGYEIRTGDKIPFISIGKKKNIIAVPASPDAMPKLNRRHYSFIWKHQMGPLLNQLGLDSLGQKRWEDYT